VLGDLRLPQRLPDPLLQVALRGMESPQHPSPELVSYARSAVRPPAVVRHTGTGPAFWIRFRVLVTRYERGRPRDVLYVDDVFSPDLYSPVELCDPQRAGEPKAIWGCGRAPFVWDAQLERHVPPLVQREPGD
jgi:hypothetical protein